MMQVSTPIHVPVISDAAQLGEQESGQSKAVQSKSLKNNRLGVFAKILEGLVENTKEGESLTLKAGLVAKDSIAAKTSAAAEHESKGNEKDKKLISLAGAKEKAGERLSLKQQNIQQDTVDFAENASLLVSQNTIKASADQVKNTGSAVQSSSKEKKAELSLQNLGKAKTVISQKEEGAGTGMFKTESESLSQIIPKTEDGSLKGKNNDKDSARKVGSSAFRTGQDRKGEAIQAGLNAQQHINTEKEVRNGSRLAEARRDKRRDRVSVEVQNLRSWETPGKDSAQGDYVTGEVKSVVEIKSPELTSEFFSGAKTRESAQGEGGNRSVQVFEDILARELNGNLNNDIVRQAQVVLRDGGEGTIRLALKPEFLGNVKIQLEMAENKITGHIIVESNEALRAFEREIHSLEQAFEDAGFAGASLDTALASGNDGNGADRQWRGNNSDFFVSERFAASVYDAASDNVEEMEISPLFGEKPDGIPEGYMPVNVLA